MICDSVKFMNLQPAEPNTKFLLFTTTIYITGHSLQQQKNKALSTYTLASKTLTLITILIYILFYTRLEWDMHSLQQQKNRALRNEYIHIYIYISL